MNSLRQEVSELMALVHLIPAWLAAEHVAEMDDVEVWDRFQRYTGMELSAAGEQSERSTSLLAGFDARNDSSTLAALNSVSDTEGAWRIPSCLDRKKKTGSEVGVGP